MTKKETLKDKEITKGESTDALIVADYSQLPIDSPDRKDNVGAAVQFINEKLNEYVYKGSVEIGDYVLKHFFDNSIELATSRKPNKPDSYNKLCESGALAIDAKKLSVMVRVAAQEKFFSENNIDTTGLSYTHKACLVKIFNENTKKILVENCIAKKWTTRQLDEEIAKILRPGNEKNIAELTESCVNQIERISKFIDDNNTYNKIAELENMKGVSKTACIKKVTRLKEEINKSITKLQTLSSNCEEILKK